MRNDLIKYTLALVSAGLVLGVAGCGGGGGGGGSAPPPSPDTVSGTVTDNSGNNPNGDVVKFDDLTGTGVDGSVTGVTSSTGTYSLSVPASDITGSDSLWIFDSSGNLLDIVSVTVPAGGGQSVTSSPTLPTTPPDPPGNCFGRRPC